MSQIDWGGGKYESTAADLLPAARELVAAAQIEPGEHVVDVGAGTGNVALAAADLGARVTAVEPAARLRAVIEESVGDRDLTVVDGTAASIPLPDGSADAILSNFASSPSEYWETRIASHPLGVAAFPLLEKAGRLTEVRTRALQAIADNSTTSSGPSGEVRLSAQYLLATAIR